MVEEWFVRQLEGLSTSVDYETKKLLLEISERKVQLQGEIDGESWNHQKW